MIVLQFGKFTLRQIDSDIYKFDEDLKEYEDHVQAGDEEAWQGERWGQIRGKRERERREWCVVNA